MNASSPMLDSLREYPAWFVAGCLTVVAAGLLWIAVKVMKWMLYLLIAAVIVVGLGTTVWLWGR